MPSNAVHVQAGALVIVSVRAIDSLTSNSLLPTNGFNYVIASALFMFGCGAADLFALFYAVPLRGRKRVAGMSLWSPSTWDDRVFKLLDERSWWSVPYKVAHSFIFGSAIFVLLYYYYHSNFVLWFATAHYLHIVMDDPEHQRSWFWYPLKFRLWSKFRNWYDDKKGKLKSSVREEYGPGIIAIIYHVSEAVWYLS